MVNAAFPYALRLPGGGSGPPVVKAVNTRATRSAGHLSYGIPLYEGTWSNSIGEAGRSVDEADVSDPAAERGEPST
jgi:hypothetical protein